MNYTFELTGNFVKISNSDTTEIISLIPVNLTIIRKLSDTVFSFNIMGQNAQLIINWTNVTVPDYSSYLTIDEFLVALAAVTNTAIGGGGLAVAFDANAAATFPTGTSSSVYRVTVAGTVQGVILEIGDVIYPKVTPATAIAADWYVVQNNVFQASETVIGLSELATQAETDAGVDDLRIVTPLKLTTFLNTRFTSLPKARYVYLVQDAADATAMGGATNNVYSTFQTAYNAADTLQVALGGSNKVVIQVGNTTSATVGNLILAANFNANIEIIGLSSTNSVLGTVTGNFTFNTKLSGLTIGNITTTAAVTIIAKRCVVGIINTSSTASGAVTLSSSADTTFGNIVMTASAGASGNLTVSNCNDIITGTINQDATGGNVGTLTMATSNNVLYGLVSRSQLNTGASFSIGSVTLTTCRSILFSGTFTSVMFYASSTGTITGLSINSSNIDISFTGNFRMSGFDGVAATTASNVPITTFAVFNTTFGALYLNHRATASTIHGGYIVTFIAHKCIFRSIVRVGYNVVTPVITGVTFRCSDCIAGTGGTGVSLDFTVRYLEVSFDSFVIEKYSSNYNQGFLGGGLYVSAEGGSTVPTMTTGTTMVLNSIHGGDLFLSMSDGGVPNTVVDAIVSNCSFPLGVSLNYDGDVGYKFIKSSVNTYFTFLGLPTTLITEFIDCNITQEGAAVLSYETFIGSVDLLRFKNTYFEYYSTLGAQTVDLVAYNSYIESISDAATITTFTGTMYTSTLKKLTTDISTLTLNNSFEQSY